MHRLTQARILRQMSDDTRSFVFRLALDVVDSYFPQYDDSDRLIDSWPQCGRALPHVVHLVDVMKPVTNHDASVYLKLGQLLERASW